MPHTVLGSFAVGLALLARAQAFTVRLYPSDKIVACDLLTMSWDATTGDLPPGEQYSLDYVDGDDHSKVFYHSYDTSPGSTMVGNPKLTLTPGTVLSVCVTANTTGDSACSPSINVVVDPTGTGKDCTWITDEGLNITVNPNVVAPLVAADMITGSKTTLSAGKGATSTAGAKSGAETSAFSINTTTTITIGSCLLLALVAGIL